jgi:hypothetical protein
MFNTSFLPADYEAPKSIGNYLKLQDGETKIRILSLPLLGWEDWEDKKPVRYKMDNKPEFSNDPLKPLKHFWAMIVWNYTDQKIQIFQVTQATIIRELVSLIEDSDWGTPFRYDIKIKKTGKEMQTKYSVTAVPHRAITKDIMDAYAAKPIFLEALFHNADPFLVNGLHTEGCFYLETALKDENKHLTLYITDDQLKELTDLIGDDEEYEQTLLTNLQKHFGIKEYKDLPSNKFASVLASVKLHAQQRLEKEMGTSKELPF